MRHLTAIICLTIALLLGSAGEGWSADYQKGLDAYNKEDYATALREFKPLAEQGNADAQANLGWMYLEGQGVPQDDKAALKWNTLAAEQGNADAQTSLGYMYHEGIGVPKNHETAAKWYRLAVKQGHEFAQELLEELDEIDNDKDEPSPDFQKGLTAYDKEDYATALRHFKPLAEKGHADAQHKLGVMYEWGEGVGQNYKVALKWYTLAADQGNVDAKNEVSRLQEIVAGEKAEQIAKEKRLAEEKRLEERDADANADIVKGASGFMIWGDEGWDGAGVKYEIKGCKTTYEQKMGPFSNIPSFTAKFTLDWNKVNWKGTGYKQMNNSVYFEGPGKSGVQVNHRINNSGQDITLYLNAVGLSAGGQKKIMFPITMALDRFKNAARDLMKECPGKKSKY